MELIASPFFIVVSLPFVLFLFRIFQSSLQLYPSFYTALFPLATAPLSLLTCSPHSFLLQTMHIAALLTGAGLIASGIAGYTLDPTDDYTSSADGFWSKFKFETVRIPPFPSDLGSL